MKQHAMVAKAANHKKKMIEVHQHLVARVMAKQYLRDRETHAFQILENMGLYEDPETKLARDELMPWLYSEVESQVRRTFETEAYLRSKRKFIQTP